jgi:hypothetical protein
MTYDDKLEFYDSVIEFGAPDTRVFIEKLYINNPTNYLEFVNIGG